MYTNNDDYFKNWSQNMAYIVGFTMSDGCIDDKNKHNLVSWNINKKDISVLEFIKNEISPTRPIYYHKNGRNIQLSITSKTIVADLAKYNIIPNKTFNEKLGYIPQEYKSHYLRGLFDGDGNISFSNRERKSGKRIGSNRQDYEYRLFSASESFLKEVQQQLCFNFGNISKQKTCYALRISNKEEICKVGKFMYQNANFFLKRKFDIYEQIPTPKLYSAFSESKSLLDWLIDARCIVDKRLISERLRYGKSFEYAISTPKIKNSGYYR